MEITNSGTVNATGLQIGADKGSSGSVIVDGPGSALTSTGISSPGAIEVGTNLGSGTLSASNGAVITAAPAIDVGPQSYALHSVTQGTLNLDGAGTVLSTAQNSISRIDGSVSITHGASWNSSSVDVGTNGVSSVIIVDGPGSSWTSSGTVHFGGSLGVPSLTISNGASVSVATFMGSNGTINVAGGTLNFTSTLDILRNSLVDNGVVNGNFVMEGTLSGSGIVTGNLLASGATISPGNSPGMLTVGSFTGQVPVFQFEMNSAVGTAGGTNGWNLLNSLNAASFQSGFGNTRLDLVSLTTADTPGNVADFDPTKDYQWTFLNAGGGITGFDPAEWTIDTSKFSNSFQGHFSVSQIGNSLVLNYMVPEPSTFAMGAIGLTALAAISVKRRRALARARRAAASLRALLDRAC